MVGARWDGDDEWSRELPPEFCVGVAGVFLRYSKSHIGRMSRMCERGSSEPNRGGTAEKPSSLRGDEGFIVVSGGN